MKQENKSPPTLHRHLHRQLVGPLAVVVLWAICSLSSLAVNPMSNSSVNRERATLSGTPNWVANPDNYASLQNIHFAENGTGNVVFGHGQWIYADIQFRYEIQSPGVLLLIYLDSPHRLSSEFSFYPNDTNRTKLLRYVLRTEKTSGITNVVATRFWYQRTLVLEDSPYPSGLKLPYEPPKVFYGHPHK